MNTRAAGHYWIKLGPVLNGTLKSDEWRIGYFANGWWYLPGSEIEWGEPAEVGERLEHATAKQDTAHSPAAN